MNRFFEIDFLRGFAIIIMIIYHLFYDLNFFNFYNINIGSGLWWYFARVIASTFILLVGISLTLSYSRAKKPNYAKYMKRGFRIFSWGLLITLMTGIFLRQGFVMFGVLHLIGVSIILAYPFLKFRFLNLFTGIIFIIFGTYIKNFTFDFPWLMWLGLRPESLYTFDYFPIFPWFGLVLIGLFIGNSLYPNYKRKFKLPDISNFSFVRLFCFLGRKSLFIYLIHQPILITLIYLLGVV